MSLAFLFPGQGSQKVGMGLDLFERSELGKERYEQANEVMAMDIASLSFRGPEELLQQTEYTQPAVFIVSTILAELMVNAGQSPAYAAGHSLGEYSALTVAGALPFEEALKLVKIRGESMQEAGAVHPGTMAAIIGLERGDIEAICKEASSEGIVQPANFNSHNQIVISGEILAVHKAMRLARERRAKKVVELRVSGAFHSPLMVPAKKAIESALEKVPFTYPRFPIVMNVTAEPTTIPAQIRKNLIEQLDHPVLWVETIRHLVSLGVSRCVEVGPGRVLQGLIKQIDRSLDSEGVESFDQVLEFSNA